MEIVVAMCQLYGIYSGSFVELVVVTTDYMELVAAGMWSWLAIWVYIG